MIQEMLRKHLSMLIKQIQLGRSAIFSNRQNSLRTEREPHVAHYKQDHPPGTFSLQSISLKHSVAVIPLK